MRLVRPTEIDRALVSQEWRVVLEKDGGQQQPGMYRSVQVVIPQNNIVYLSVEEDAGTAKGLDRTYRGAPFPPNIPVRFNLLPDQKLWAAADIGKAPLSLIIEYCTE